MKSILSASWLLTVAVGNLVVVLVAESKFVANQVYEYILFAGLLLVATVIFIIICCYYKYIEDEESHGEEDENDDDSSVSTSKKLS
jgi:solute carrier family 15 oligopeptide transporter 1